MRIAGCRIFRYRLPLAKPLALGGRTVDERAGALVRIDSDSGASGWGDVAPLPGFSRESLEDAETELATLGEALRGAELPSREHEPARLRPGSKRQARILPNGSKPRRIVSRAASRLSVDEIAGRSRDVDETVSPIRLDGDDPGRPGTPATPLELEPVAAASPSVRFGLETALAGLSTRIEREAGPSLPCFDGAVPVGGLLAGPRSEVLAHARRLRDAGYRAVKLKVGMRPVTEDVALTRAVRAALGTDIALRLDANRRWSLEQAVRFGHALGAAGVEYLEEPLGDPSRLEDFFDATGIAVALDESLQEIRPSDLEGLRGVGAVVLKPTLLGGAGRARAWIARARELDMRPVVSGCFESGVGILALAKLAWSSTGDAVPAGLDTYRWLDTDVVRPRIPVRAAVLRWSEALARSHRIDAARLCEIRHG